MRAGIDAVSSSPRLVSPTDDRGPEPKKAKHRLVNLFLVWTVAGWVISLTCRIEEMVSAGRRAVIRRQAGLCS